MSKKVAVTGSTGFLGSYLLSALRSDGIDAIGLGRSDSAEVVTDYSDKHLCEVFAGVDCVVHLAARTMLRSDEPDDISVFLDPNVILASNVYRCARSAGVKRFVFASSRSVYGSENQEPFDERDIARPNTAYGLSKLMAEMSLNLLSKYGKGPEVCALRMAAYFGYGERESPVLMKFVGQAMRQEKIVVTGNPEYAIDQLYVEDAAKAFSAAVRSVGVTGTFNIGCGRRLSLREIAETVNRVFHNPQPVQYRNVRSASGFGGWMDINSALEKLQWSPCYSLSEGLMAFRNFVIRAQEKGMC